MAGGRRRFAGRRAVFGATAAAALLTALPAPAAQAADRYVEPAGSGTECTAAKPCSVVEGINKATDGDLVHVAGGVYPLLTTNLSVPAGVTVLGEVGDRPEITFGSSGSFGAYVEADVSGLDLSRDSGFAIVLAVGPTGTASRMRVGSPAGGLPVELHGLLRDSFVESVGKSPAVQASGSTGRLHNVTVIARGADSAAVHVASSPAFPPIPCSPGEITLRNVIAQGPYAVQESGVSECPAKADIGHSNYDPGAVLINGPGEVVDAGGNQIASTPLLDPDDLHQLVGSPTIDAGIALAQNGPVDFDGQPRLLGDAPDIGADEFPSPPKAPETDSTAPLGSALRLKPKRFRPAAKRRKPVRAASTSRKRRKGAPRTARVAYSLSEDATVRFTVKRRMRGVRRGKRCVTARRALRKGGKRCRKLVAAGRPFLHQGRAGANAFRFSGWLGSRSRRRPSLRALAPGAYRLVGVPTDAAGNVGPEFGASFTIVR